MTTSGADRPRLALTLVGLLASLVIAVAGCSSGAGVQGDPSDSSHAPDASPTMSSPSSTPEVTAPRDLPTTEAGLSDAVEFDTGVSVAIESVTTTQVSATTPGEVDGTACVVKVAVRNDSGSAIDLGSAVVTATAGDDYGVETTSEPSAPFSAPLSPGASTTGTYVFMLDPQDRQLTITVNYAAGQPIVIFHGEPA